MAARGWKNMLKKIFCIKNKEDNKVITILGVTFKIKSKKLAKKFNEIKERESLKQQLIQISQHAKRITPRLALDTIGFHLVDHCNLNCWGCDVGSPIAEERFVTLESFVKDIKKLAELTSSNIKNILLSGGEALLNPHIFDMCKAAREAFPCAKIKIYSNGILLPQKEEDFWKFLEEYKISLACTKYPIKVDYDKIKEKADLHNVDFEFINNAEVTKTSYHIPFDTAGKQDERENFINCFHANECIGIHDGKIYTCSPAANAHHFNKFFNAGMEITDSNYINIHEASSMEEILAFLARPIPFCRYCNVKGRTFCHDWTISRKEKSEWFIEN